MNDRRRCVCYVLLYGSFESRNIGRVGCAVDAEIPRMLKRMLQLASRERDAPTKRFS